LRALPEKMHKSSDIAVWMAQQGCKQQLESILANSPIEQLSKQ